MDRGQLSHLMQDVETRTFPAAAICTELQQIHQCLLKTSRGIDRANFTQIHTDDLRLMFDEYDHRFFGGRVRQSLEGAPLRFELSKRMTSAGGKTTRRTNHRTGYRDYRISVSATMLFGCFHDDDHRPIMVAGVVCRDRLAALQRVMEHEIVHLVEMLLWEKSSCAKPRFHGITRRFFDHQENTHRMITPREKAMVKYGIRPGTRVRFRFDGVEHQGIVNRVTKRATVLVEDPRGQRYMDGKTYAKYYVPVPLLEAVK